MEMLMLISVKLIESAFFADLNHMISRYFIKIVIFGENNDNISRYRRENTVTSSQ